MPHSNIFGACRMETRTFHDRQATGALQPIPGPYVVDRGRGLSHNSCFKPIFKINSFEDNEDLLRTESSDE